MAYNVYYEDVEVGQEIPAFTRETDFMHWNRYAAVNEEFVYIHMDDEAGKAAGQGAAFGMGNLRWAYVLNALRAWIGDEAEVRELSLQFRAVNHKHDVLRTSGVVTEKKQENGENLVVLEVNVLNQKDEKTAPGQAVVVLPSRG
ncbi:MAG TPA: MaoC/PaaZ C-terminal domain-containing protein [Streptosporangiaceae bacterium]